LKMNHILIMAFALLAQAPQAQIEEIASVRHPGGIVGIAITPDSRTALLARDDKWLLAYSLETGQSRGCRFLGYIKGLALSPRGDRLVVTTDNNQVSLIDAGSLRTILTQELSAGPEDVSFTPDGLSILVTTDTGHLMKLAAWNLAPLLDLFPTEKSRVIGMACSPDGTTVATSDRDGKIKLWAVETLSLLREWKAHDRYARTLAFDPTGNYLVSGGEESVLKVWRTPDYALVKESKDYHQQSIHCIAFSPDGRMVTGGYDGLCQIWTVGSFEAGKSLTDYRGYITACAISADGRWLVRGGSSLDLVPMDRPEKYSRLASYGGSILDLAVAPDGMQFATGGLDKGLYLWTVNRDDARDIRVKAAFQEDWVTAVDFCRYSRSIAAGLADGKLAVLSASSLSPEKSWAAHKGRIVDLAAYGGSVVTIGDDAAVRLWDLDGTRLRQCALDSACRSMTLRDDRLAVGTSSGSIVICNAVDLSKVHTIKGRPFTVTALGFTRDGGGLVVGYFDGGIELYDSATWRPVNFKAGEGSSILSIAANPGMGGLAISRRDGSVDLLNQQSLDKAASWEGDGFEVFSVRWVLDGKTLAVAGASNGVSLKRVKGGMPTMLGMGP
jgi:WD40 repeat protein